MQAVGGAALTTNDSLTTGDADDAVTGDAPPGVAAGGAGTETAVAPPAAGPARTALLVFAGIAALVVAVDVVTKQLAVSQLPGREPVRLLGGAVYLLLTRNSGAAFSFAAGYTFVFSIIAMVVIGWISWMARQLRSPAWGLSLGLVLGGTVGNLLDRIFRAPGPFLGHVVDFISVFDPAGQGFPVFNAADSALCVGVTLAVLLEMTGRRRDGTRVLTGREPRGDGGPAS